MTIPRAPFVNQQELYPQSQSRGAPYHVHEGPSRTASMFQQMNKDGNSYPVWICELSAEEKEKKDERIHSNGGGEWLTCGMHTGAERSHCTVRWALWG